MNFLQIILIFNYIIFGYSHKPVYEQPEQIHLSYGGPNKIWVTWVTLDPLPNPTVRYGIKLLDKVSIGSSKKFVDGGKQKRHMYIHRALMQDLIPGNEYVYNVGSEKAWSPIFWFRALKEGNDWSPRLIVFGDLGNSNGRSIPRLQNEAQESLCDMILHVGDFAYDMDSDNARIGDEFMRQMEPLAAYVPYQTTVGNHENAYNFSNYVERFTMIDFKTKKMNNHFYSYNIGPAHIISFSTEFYFFTEYGTYQIKNQYEWLENDLKEANNPENRKKQPWIITLGHRPMYCSTKDKDDCTHRESIIRKGIPPNRKYGLEDLFYKYGVDLEIWAHEHVYERLYPLYDYKVYKGSEKEPYTNPTAPVHIITGSAGCPEELDPFVLKPAEWSAKRISDYGYTRMVIYNSTHLHIKQVSDMKEGEVVDEIMIIKHSHGKYPDRIKEDSHYNGNKENVKLLPISDY